MIHPRRDRERQAITPPCYPITAGQIPVVIEKHPPLGHIVHMKQKLAILSLVAALGLAPAAASAACYVEYKAKRDTPYALIYDVAQVGGPCTRKDAKARLARQLKAQGLILLKVISVTER